MPYISDKMLPAFSVYFRYMGLPEIGTRIGSAARPHNATDQITLDFGQIGYSEVVG